MLLQGIDPCLPVVEEPVPLTGHSTQENATTACRSSFSGESRALQITVQNIC
jgi:hypothetical protein